MKPTNGQVVSSLTDSPQSQVPSGRSIDGGTPTSDSNIINLSIKPFAHGQGFSAAKARNIVFANDPSLNAIPAGINNELSNVDVRSSVAPPNAVLRDSYGNPVTPFTDLASTDLESVGFLTSVNRDSRFPSSNVAKGERLNFQVPSYASGIIEPIGLPPSSPVSPVRVGPTGSATTAPSAVTQQQFLPNAKIPTIEEGNIQFAQKPVNGLLPPLFPDQLPPVYSVNVGTERSPIFARDPFGAPVTKVTLPHPAFGSGTDPASHVGFKTDVNKQTSFHQPTPATENRFSGAQTPVQNKQPPQIQPVQPTPVTATKPPAVQKYTGGFGGPGGLLGSQQNLGTAYTSTAKPVPQSATPIAQAAPSAGFQNSFPTTARPAERTTVTKYSGSFGGSPGFLGSQQNLGTAYNKPVPTAPVAVPSPVHFHPAPAVPTGQAFAPPSASKPVPQAGASVTAQPPNKFTGSFGFASGNQGPANPVVRPTVPSQVFLQQPARPAGSASFNGGNKFTGSFGGAPGLLGSQQQLGTHVKPDGSILSPSSPGVGFSAAQTPINQQQHQQQQQQQLHAANPAGTVSKFTGSFGGPPGVLRPFDNTNG